MNILSFDTCLDKMYVALESAQGIASKIVETTKENYHSAFLISTIADVLRENNLSPKDIDVIATNIGPGSFTGIRACTTVARVMAQGHNKNIKAVGISSLEIISRINHLTSHLSPITLVALDARKEMAYVAIYENGKEIFHPQVILIEDLEKMIAANNYNIVTDDVLKEKIGGISYQNSNEDLGKILLEISKEKLTAGIETDWRKLLPLYIQPPAVHIKK